MPIRKQITCPIRLSARRRGRQRLLDTLRRGEVEGTPASIAQRFAKIAVASETSRIEADLLSGAAELVEEIARQLREAATAAKANG